MVRCRRTEPVLGPVERFALRPAHIAVTFAALVSAACPAVAGSVLPTAPSVAAGSVTFSQPNSSTLNINQSTNQAIINWNSFSVGKGNTVNFNQPGASSVTLDRVTGSTPSWIAGTINAPGTVLLVNPNGIEITKSGVINTGSFAASTLNIKDSDFLSGNYKFTGNGASAGVINNGRINVSDGGFAALLGGQATNNGVIAARLGFVAMGAGEQATLDLSGDGFLSVAIPSSQLGKLVNANGALVSNNGKILANGGTVFLSAATASTILRNAVNMGGSIRANSVGSHDGRIVINGGSGGSVQVAGRISAKGNKVASGGSVAIWGNGINVTGISNVGGATGGTDSLISTGDLYLAGTIFANGWTGEGGEVDITATNNVSLVAATIAASGATGGGDINIGGGPHATTALADAQSLSVDSATVIRVNATDNGNGGHVVLWSDGTTTATGSIYATGGPNGGNGGLIETSGQTVNFDGLRVNTSAAQGAFGTWLIDPTDLIIDANAANTISGDLGTSNVTLQTTANGVSGPGGTTGNTQSGSGDIDVESAITWTTNASLTLNAYNNINVDAYISNYGNNATIAGGTLTLTAGNAIYVNANISLGGSNSALALNYNAPVNLPQVYFTSGGSVQFGYTDTNGNPCSACSLTMNGQGYTLLFNNFNGLTNMSGHYALGGAVGSGQNLGTSGTPFNGVLEGLGNGTSGGTIFNYIGFNGVVAGIGEYYQGNTFGGNLIANNSEGIILDVWAGSCCASGYGMAQFSLSAGQGVLVGTQTNGGEIADVWVQGQISGPGAGIVGFLGPAAELTNASFIGITASGGAGLVGTANNTVISDVLSITNNSPIAGSVIGATPITAAYYDSTVYGGTATYGTGLTTTLLQSTRPSGFSGANWRTPRGGLSLFDNAIRLHGIARRFLGTLLCRCGANAGCAGHHGQSVDR